MNFSNSKEKFDDYWIGEVPEHWKSSRIKNIVSFSPGFSDEPPVNEKKYTIVPMEAVSVTGEINNKNKGSFENISTGLTHFENGDVLFAKITPCMENGKGAYVNNIETKYGFGSTEFHVLRPTHQVDGIFLYFYTFNTQYRDYAALNMTGAAGQKRVSSKFLAYTRIYLPEIKQQKRISAFLKETCSTINTTIKIKQKQLETLGALKKSIIHKAVTQGIDDSVEMKDSGVDWLGEIPRHWKVKILKRDFNVTLGKMLQSQKKKETETEEYYLRSANIKWSGVDISNVRKMWFAPVEKTRLKLESEDLLVSEGGDVGRSSIWCGELSNCYIQNAINRVRPKSGQGSNRFLFYCLFTLKVSGYIDAIVSRITIAHLTAEKLEKLIYVSPPLSEQVDIANHLDQKTTRIENLKKNILKQIEILEQYRKSIVHECVTGKRRVTENDIKEH